MSRAQHQVRLHQKTLSVCEANGADTGPARHLHVA